VVDLEKIKQEYRELTEKLTDPGLISHWEEFQELSKRRAQLQEIVTKAEQLQEINQRIEENNQIIASQEEELSSLAQEELNALLKQKEIAEKQLESLLQENSDSHQNIPDAIIMEIRPGTGGEEASLFARDLFAMYTKYAEQRGWKYTVLEMNDTELGGIREASIEFQGREAYNHLRYEGGVHRVQRIPTTEKAGRVHTSTASVAILPKPKKAQLQLNPAELNVVAFNASGPGGQNVNKRKTAVRITHLPTGLVVASQASRNQQQNREFALTLLAAKLLQQREEAEQQKTAKERRTQMGTSERAEKIRTYNVPQDRVTDHRIGKSWHNIEAIMAGGLDEVVEELEENAKIKSQKPK
jgi:peptide chain release factor 1